VNAVRILERVDLLEFQADELLNAVRAGASQRVSVGASASCRDAVALELRELSPLPS
jgi:hypothetical protein